MNQIIRHTVHTHTVQYIPEFKCFQLTALYSFYYFFYFRNVFQIVWSPAQIVGRIARQDFNFNGTVSHDKFRFLVNGSFHYVVSNGRHRPHAKSMKSHFEPRRKKSQHFQERRKVFLSKTRWQSLDILIFRATLWRSLSRPHKYKAPLQRSGQDHCTRSSTVRA